MTAAEANLRIRAHLALERGERLYIFEDPFEIPSFTLCVLTPAGIPNVILGRFDYDAAVDAFKMAQPDNPSARHAQWMAFLKSPERALRVIWPDFGD